MPTDHDLILAGLILIVGLLYSSVGHAGASGYIAVMVLMGVSAGVLKSTPLVLNVLVAAIGTFQFWRAGYFTWSLFWPFALTAAPMAYYGRTMQLRPEVYSLILGAVLLFSAWRIVSVSFKNTEAPVRPPSLPLALIVGAVLGFVAGLTSTGGGIFLSPLMLLCRWAEPKRAAGVSAPFILANSAAGIIAVVGNPNTEWPGALPWWCAAAVVGGLVGSYLGARKFDTRNIRRMLAVVLVIAGAKLCWDGAGLIINPPKGTAPAARP